MNSLGITALDTLETVLKNPSNGPLFINKNGSWYQGSRVWYNLTYPMRVLLGYEAKRLYDNASVFLQKLNENENIPLDLKNTDQKKMYVSAIAVAKLILRDLNGVNYFRYHASVNEQKKIFTRHILALESRLNVGSKKEHQDNAPTVKADISRLTMQAAQWKLGKKNLSTQTLTKEDLDRFDKMIDYPEFVELLNQDNQKQLRSAFFDWVIQCQQPPHSFVLFPAKINRIKKCYLSMRTGTKNQPLPAIKVKTENGKVDLTLPFYGWDKEQQRMCVKDYSILDERTVVQFGKTISDPISTILDVFANKNKEVGRYEFLHYADGELPAIAYYDIHNWKYIDVNGNDAVIDLNDPNYYELIAFTKKLTLEQAQQEFDSPFKLNFWILETKARFGQRAVVDWIDKNFKDYKEGNEVDWEDLIKKIDLPEAEGYKNEDFKHWLKDSHMRYGIKVDGIKWITFGAATRTDLKDLKVDGCHGITGIAIPTADGKHYEVRYFGKFAKKFPYLKYPGFKKLITSPKNMKELIKSALELWFFFCGSNDTVVEAPDTNPSYLMRQPASYGVVKADASIGKQAFDYIREVQINARKGEEAFQYQVRGCGEFSQTFVNKQRELVGLRPFNPFLTTNKKPRPQFPISIVHWIARQGPSYFQMRVLFLMFAPWQSHKARIDGELKDVSFYHSKEWRDMTSSVPGKLHPRQMREIYKVLNGIKIKNPAKGSLLPPGMWADYLIPEGVDRRILPIPEKSG